MTSLFDVSSYSEATTTSLTKLQMRKFGKPLFPGQVAFSRPIFCSNQAPHRPQSPGVPGPSRTIWCFTHASHGCAHILYRLLGVVIGGLPHTSETVGQPVWGQAVHTTQSLAECSPMALRSAKSFP